MPRPPIVENQAKNFVIGSDDIFMSMSMEHCESEGGKVTFHGYSMQDEDALIQTSAKLAESIKPDELVQVGLCISISARRVTVSCTLLSYA